MHITIKTTQLRYAASIWAVCLCLLACKREQQNVYPADKTESTTTADEWADLLDADLSGWEKFIGVPHYSVELPFNHPKGDGMNGTPLGLNNDPLNVFSTYQQDGNTILKISGEIYGGLTTKEEYSNYHLKAEFKWGEEKFEPRLNLKRDNGILYHCYGAHGAFWNVWMNSQEMQIQETDIGDYFALGPTGSVPARFDSLDNERAWIYDKTAPLQSFGKDNPIRCRRARNMENAHGEWNTLELICHGDSSLHIVNGVVVLRLYNSARDGQALTKGKIQIQSEGAEAYFRNIRIKQIDSFPTLYQ